MLFLWAQHYGAKHQNDLGWRKLPKTVAEKARIDMFVGVEDEGDPGPKHSRPGSTKSG